MAENAKVKAASLPICRLKAQSRRRSVIATVS